MRSDSRRQFVAEPLPEPLSHWLIVHEDQIAQSSTIIELQDFYLFPK